MDLATDDEAERKKFELAQEIKDEVDVLVLQGFRQMKALAYVRDFLKQQGKGASDQDMEKWSLDFALCSFPCDLSDLKLRH